VFIAGVCSQILVLVHFFLDQNNVFAVNGNDPLELAFLWYNLIAPAIVVVLAVLLQAALPSAGKGMNDEAPGLPRAS
jgi:hypothetical protein